MSETPFYTIYISILQCNFNANGTADQLELIDVHSLSIQFPVSTLQQNFGIA